VHVGHTILSKNVTLYLKMFFEPAMLRYEIINGEVVYIDV